MRRLHLFWPHLLLRLALARLASSKGRDGGSASSPDRSPTREPIVVGSRPWAGGLVLDANATARALGIRRGLSLAAAERLVPEVRRLEPSPEADRAAVEAVLERLAAFSPTLAGATEPTDPAFGFVEVGIDGLELLWGEERILAERLISAAAPLLPGRPQVGIAGTRFAATVAAVRAGPSEPCVVPPGGEAAFLAPLPVSILTPDPEARARLLRFGLRRVGQVAALPRTALVARFGPEGIRIHARAVGEEVEPVEVWRRPERVALGCSLEPAVDRLDALRFVLHRLVTSLIGHAAARGQAASIAELRLGLEAGPDLAVRQVLPEPTSDGEAIERLLLVRLERRPPSAPVVRLELELGGLVAEAGHQLTLFEPQRAKRGRLAWQLARLAVEFGPDRVVEAEILDPEARWGEARSRWRPWSGPARSDEAGGRSLESAATARVRVPFVPARLDGVEGRIR